MILLRTLAAVAGVGILAAVAHVTIAVTGGYGWNTNAPLTIALAVGVALGAPVASLSRPTLAVLLCLSLLAGEAYGFLATASWHVANIEVQAAPIHDAEARHAAAKARLEAAESSDTVQRAIDMQAAHASEAMTRSAEKTCNAVCRATIADTARSDQAVVVAAKESMQRDIDRARTDLANAPLPGSASPRADRLGVKPRELDLLGAGLRSFACTVLAGGLLAFAAHSRNEVALPKLDDVPAPKKVGRFMIDRLEAAPRPRVESADLYSAYCDWCESNNSQALPAAQFGDVLVPVLNEVGIRRKMAGSDVFLCDVRLAG
jgi:hypothetical protein